MDRRPLRISSDQRPSRRAQRHYQSRDRGGECLDRRSRPSSCQSASPGQSKEKPSMRQRVGSKCEEEEKTEGNLGRSECGLSRVRLICHSEGCVVTVWTYHLCCCWAQPSCFFLFARGVPLRCVRRLLLCCSGLLNQRLQLWPLVSVRYRFIDVPHRTYFKPAEQIPYGFPQSTLWPLLLPRRPGSAHATYRIANGSRGGRAVFQGSRCPSRP